MTVASASVSSTILAQAVDPTSIDQTVVGKTAYCESSSMIRGMMIECYIYNRSGNLPGQEKVSVLIRKNEGGALPNPTIGQMNAPGIIAWKSKIFQYHQAKPPAPGGLPLMAFSFKIPRRFHKMANLDQWELWVANNSTGSIDVCGICLYKWYR